VEETAPPDDPTSPCFPPHPPPPAQAVDYLTQQRRAVKSDHVLLQFDRTMALGAAERHLVHQLCVRLGFPTTGPGGEVHPPCMYPG